MAAVGAALPSDVLKHAFADDSPASPQSTEGRHSVTASRYTFENVVASAGHVLTVSWSHADVSWHRVAYDESAEQNEPAPLAELVFPVELLVQAAPAKRAKATSGPTAEAIWRMTRA